MGMIFDVSEVDLCDLMCGGYEPELFTSDLKWTRERRGMSRNELSRQSGVGVVTLQQIEECRGNPRLETIHKIMDALGCEFEDIIRFV